MIIITKLEDFKDYLQIQNNNVLFEKQKNTMNNLVELIPYEELVKKFKTPFEVYLYLKENVTKSIVEVLNKENELKNNLVALAHPDKSLKFAGELLIHTKDTAGNNLKIEIAHTFYKMENGCGRLITVLNLSMMTISTIFIRSETGQDATYAGEINGEEHMKFDIPEKNFFRHLPHLFALSQPDSARIVLALISKRKYSTINQPEHANYLTGEIVNH